MLLKRMITILLLSMIFNFAYPQKYFPTIDEQPTWRVLKTIEPSYHGPMYNIDYKLQKDTVIYGFIYSIITETNYERNPPVTKRYGFTRTDSTKVYFRKSAEEPEYLLYDFNLIAGDSVFCPFIGNLPELTKFIVIDVDTINVEGVNRKRLKVAPEDNYSMYWIEGIGSTINPFYMESYGIGGFKQELCNVKLDSTYIYKNLKFDDCTDCMQQTSLIVNPNVIWSEMAISGNIDAPDSLESYRIRFEGDTLLGDWNYTKVWKSTDSLQTNWELIGLIQEENRKVWFHYLWDEETFFDVLLYDFSLEIGNIFYDKIIDESFYVGLRVVNIDTINILGINHLRIQLSHDGLYEETWIEKIGNPDKGILKSYDTLDTLKKVLLCVNENGNEIYHNGSYQKCFYTLNDFPVNVEMIRNESIIIYPNPMKDNLTISVNSENEKITYVKLLDLNGKEVFNTILTDSNNTLHISTLPPGLYFVQIISGTSCITKKVVKN